MKNYDIRYWFRHKDWYLVESRGKYGIVDKDENIICPIKYLEIGVFYNGLAVLKYRKNIFSKVQWGVINEKGEVTLFSGEYEDIKVLSSKLIAVKVKFTKYEEKWNSNNIEKPKKVKVKTVEYKWGIVTSNGRTICLAKYDCCPDCILDNEFWIAAIDGYFALINAEGNQLCKAKYDIIESSIIEPDIFYAYRNHCRYRMNKKGIEIKKNRCKMYF